jgi:hypothetical protein
MERQQDKPDVNTPQNKDDVGMLLRTGKLCSHYFDADFSAHRVMALHFTVHSLWLIALAQLAADVGNCAEAFVVGLMAVFGLAFLYITYLRDKRNEAHRRWWEEPYGEVLEEMKSHLEFSWAKHSVRLMILAVSLLYVGIIAFSWTHYLTNGSVTSP